MIDDDPITRTILQRVLEQHSYPLTLAQHGEEGIALARQMRPALVICDWMMPEMDGIEVCRQIKAIPELSTTFFILLTARTEVEDRVQGLDAGADEFLSKPIDPEELQARVRAGLRLHHLSRALQIQTELLEEGLAEAARYVRSLLPPLREFQEVGIKTDWRFIPSQQLGGDSFNYGWLDPDHLAVYLLDVAGHGIGAALLSVSVMNVLRSQSLPNTNFTQPESVLASLNEAFPMSSHNEMYFTIWYGVYHPKSRQLIYASGGHPPAVLISYSASAQSVHMSQLRTPNLPIGILDEANYHSASCEIPAQSDLYLFSDGAYEVFNTSGQLWGLENLIKALEEAAVLSGSSLDYALKAASTFNVSDHFVDDFSCLQIHFS